MTHTAIWNGKVIAQSDRTLEVDGYVYFPRETVRMELLAAAPKTARDLRCPHGVQFYDVAEGSAISQRAAWSYEAPQARMKSVDHWIGFWEDVAVQGAPSGSRPEISGH
jgi:uncharacterized protein (DUF427 family)